MRTVRPGPAIAMIAQVALFILLSTIVGLGVAGWIVGVAYGFVVNVTLSRALDRRGWPVALLAANRVTLLRATLVGGVTALVVDSLFRPHAYAAGPAGLPAAATTLVALTVVALILDGVDGQVARRTGTASELGARFDMEVDAFLIFVLSCYDVRIVGAWVLAIGAMRYVYVVVGWMLTWMRGPVPPRYWRKVVAAVQGIVLVLVAAEPLPVWAVELVVAGALALLVESFGRDIWWLWRRRTTARVSARVDGARRREVEQPVG
ncbi:MAG TPA: CDP-alcohol phosphatidyltransferase family protein [Micromonosporaceae bacterium]|nr:CDP-alcohol phosphatidyltransferase family protein [Micromonosporaceae bacterium]